MVRVLPACFDQIADDRNRCQCRRYRFHRRCGCSTDTQDGKGCRPAFRTLSPAHPSRRPTSSFRRSPISPLLAESRNDQHKTTTPAQLSARCERSTPSQTEQLGIYSFRRISAVSDT